MSQIKTIAYTAQRIIAGTNRVIAIKEHIDEWNKRRAGDLFLDKPELTGNAIDDAYLAAIAEYEAFLISEPCPEWANEDCRFLKEPAYFGGRNARIIALVETPFAFRRRLIFSGMTFLR